MLEPFGITHNKPENYPDVAILNTDVLDEKEAATVIPAPPARAIKSTTDFIEKPGDVIARREKKHTGRKIPSSQLHSTSRPQLNNQDLIHQELSGWGIDHPDNWRYALDPEWKARKQAEIDSIFDSFYNKEYEEVWDEENDEIQYVEHIRLNEATVEKQLKGLPQDLKKDIFLEWLAKHPTDCLFSLDKFDSLAPYDYLQQAIAEHLSQVPNGSGRFVSLQILKVFDQIIDKHVVDWMMDPWHITLDELAKYKSKLPKLSEEFLIKKFCRSSKGEIYWDKIIPYLDELFPSTDKQQALIGVLTQRTNANPAILFDYRDKFNVSMRELMDLFYNHQQLTHLANKLDQIDLLYHQEIANRLIDTGKSWCVIEHSVDFRHVNVPELISRIAALPEDQGSSYKNGLKGIIYFIANPKHPWFNQIPKEVFDQMVDRHPDLVITRADSYQGKIDEGAVVNKLFLNKNFTSLIDWCDKLGIVRDIDFAKKIISAGGGETLFTKRQLGSGIRIELFNNGVLDDEVASMLVEHGKSINVAKYIDKFTRLSVSTVRQIPNLFPDQIPKDSPEVEDFLKQLKANYLLTGEWLEGQTIDAAQLGVIEALPNTEVVQERLVDTGFTPKQLLQFAYRRGLSRHDAFVGAEDISRLYFASGLSPSQFCENILFQIVRDDASYESGTANHYLNAIANRGFRKVREVREQISNYDPEIQAKAQEILEAFPDDQTVFTSWRSLKAYAIKIDTLLNNVDRLRTIVDLEKKGKEKLARWYSEIAKSTNVNSNALIEFISDPSRFLERDASHTPEELHDRKKPSNYTDIPHLDLSAEDVRDALVEGSIDTIASLPPLELKYTFYDNPHSTKRTLQLLIGSRRNNIPGLANDPTHVFGEVQKICKQYAIPFPGYLTSTEDIPLLAEAQTALSTCVINVLDSGQYQKQRVQENGEMVATELGHIRQKTFLVSMYPKSSPYGVLAGNDTACCMPFGDGKANVYMINPACTQFTIQEERPDGTRRTQVQSVMTLNRIIPGMNVAELIARIQSGASLHSLLPEGTLSAAHHLLVADNAEAAPNFKQGQSNGALAEQLYSDFFYYYLGLLANYRPNIDFSQLQIGRNYSDLLGHLPEVSNESVPVSPLSYSDNIASTSYQLVPAPVLTGKAKVYRLNEIVPTRDYTQNTGISSLTFEDTLATAYLEGKVYEAAEGLREGLHNMQNALIAKDISNSHKNRPELSLKYIDNNGSLKAYLLAYEGVWKEESNNTDQHNEPCIYISDFASEKHSQLASGRVLNHFLALYKQHYLDTGNPLPLYAYTREGTSYDLLKKNLEAISNKLGGHLTLTELGTSNVGQDIMHTVKMEITTHIRSDLL